MVSLLSSPFSMFQVTTDDGYGNLCPSSCTPVCEAITSMLATSQGPALSLPPYLADLVPQAATRSPVLPKSCSLSSREPPDKILHFLPVISAFRGH